MEYNKISDKILYLADKVYMEIEVSYKKYNDKYNKMEYFYSEYGYSYKARKSFKMTRNIRPYIIIKTTNRNCNLCIGVDRLWEFTKVINMLCTIINEGSAFVIDNGEVIPNVNLSTSLALYNKKLTLIPSKQELEDGNSIPAILWSINDGEEYFMVTIDTMHTLNYIISNLDIYTYATNMINYLPRPEYGNNVTMLGNDSYGDDYNIQKGYFDK